jgi:hypothetical protein
MTNKQLWFFKRGFFHQKPQITDKRGFLSQRAALPTLLFRVEHTTDPAAQLQAGVR